MSGYVKWEDVKELLELIDSQSYYIEDSEKWMEYKYTIDNTLRDMKLNAVKLENNSDTYNFTINFHGYSDVDKANEFAKKFVREVKLNGGIQ